jgi:holo-[acyl-carrier protein] synthase
MFSTGIDIIEISRIEKSIQNPRFILKVFSKSEQQLFEKKGFSSQTIAANFAGKEAFSKALKTGIQGFALNEVSILRDENNAPYIKLCGNAKKLAQNKNFDISLSHTDSLATAIVIMWD